MKYHTEYDIRTQRHYAVCTCGWRSEQVNTAGLAGSLWDLHVKEQHAPDTH